MAQQKIWRYTLTRQEQTLWDVDEMKGWREALAACVEDDARERGCKKFMIFRRDELIAKGDVGKLPEVVST
jgi:hypothetical protein